MASKTVYGVIYELRCLIGSEWHPFYVGRTEDHSRRLKEHQRSVKNGTTLVYQFIREQLVPAGIDWSLFVVSEYTDDYIDQEDEHIMSLLYDGIKLKNMKKGDATWLERREAVAADMRQRGIRSYRKYCEQLSLEEQQRIAEAKHQQWLEAEAKKTAQSQRALDRQKILADLQHNVELKRAEQAKRDAEQQAKQRKRDAELQVIRARQQAIWEEQNKELVEAKRIEQEKKEQERAIIEEQLKQEAEQFANHVTTLATKFGLTPVIKKEEVKPEPSLFDELFTEEKK